MMHRLFAAALVLSFSGAITEAQSRSGPQPAPTSLVVGRTTIFSGTTSRLLFDNAGVVGELILGTNLSISGGNTLNAAGGSGTPAGSTGDIQINTSGAFAALTPGAGVTAFIATPTPANLGTALGTQTANRFYAGPVSGGAATPTFRALVAADLAASPANHGVIVDVGGAPTYKVVPDCTDTGGNHLNFTQSTDAFSCGTSDGANTVTAAGTLTSGGVVIGQGTKTVAVATDLTFSAGVLSIGLNASERGAVKMFGSTSGDLTIRPPAVAGTASFLTFPGASFDFSASGGASQVVKQTSAGGAFSVARLACADLSDAAAGCSGSGTATGVGVQGGQSVATIGDNTTALAATHYAYLVTALTASRTRNLMDSTTQGVGDFYVSDANLKLITSTNTEVLCAAGTDKLNNTTNGCVTLNVPGSAVWFHNDGAGNFSTPFMTGLPNPGASQVLTSSSGSVPQWSNAVAQTQIAPATFATGTTHTLVAPAEIWECTGTCTVTPPTPAAGYQFCIRNANNVSTVITLAAVANTLYEKTTFAAYGTANTAATSGGAAGDKICLLGKDSTHYDVMSFNGTWSMP